MIESLLARPPGPLVPSIYTRLPDGPYAVGNYGYTVPGLIGTKVYFESGKNFRTYDVVTGVWGDGAALAKRNNSLTFSYGTSHVTSGLLHVHGSTAGGIYQPDPFAVGTYYNPSTNKWVGVNIGSYTTDKAYWGYNVASAYDAATGILVTCGGTDFNGAANNYTYISDYGKASWTRVNTPYYALGNGNSAQFVNGAFHILGGGGLLSKYVKASQAWTQLATCPSGGGAAAGKKLSIYNPATNTWQAKETGGPGGSYIGLVVYGDTLFIFSGVQVWTADLSDF